jgi:hypothetical protein
MLSIETKMSSPLHFNPNLPLFWALDFNFNLMCSVIGREGERVYILAELLLPDSSTWQACEAFFEKLSEWKSRVAFFPQVRVYGDATGKGPHTAASRTDWESVREFFNRHPCKLEFRVPSSKPPVKDRVNCVNARLLNQAGERRIRIDPRCTQLVKDLDRVHWKTDTHGNMLPELDKSDPQRSHLSDALGYMIAYEFGMRGKFGEMPGLVQ